MKSPMLSLAVDTRLEFLFPLFCLRDSSESSRLLGRPRPFLMVTASGPAKKCEVRCSKVNIKARCSQVNILRIKLMIREAFKKCQMWNITKCS